jgi:hypothetical protein
MITEMMILVLILGVILLAVWRFIRRNDHVPGVYVPVRVSGEWHCDLCGETEEGRSGEGRKNRLPPEDWLFLPGGEESGVSVDICICDECWRAIWRATVYGRNQ